MKKHINILVVIILMVLSVSVNSQVCVDCDGGSASGTTASIIGINNTASGTGSFAGGLDCQAVGKESFAFGDSARAMSMYSIALGKEVLAFGGTSVAMGRYLQTTISSSMAIGYGFDEDNLLENSTLNSILFGCNSDRPTLFIGSSSGLGYTGRIGIGNVTDPQAKLHIKGDDNEDADLLLEPGASHYAKIKFDGLAGHKKHLS